MTIITTYQCDLCQSESSVRDEFRMISQNDRVGDFSNATHKDLCRNCYKRSVDLFLEEVEFPPMTGDVMVIRVLTK